MLKYSLANHEVVICQTLLLYVFPLTRGKGIKRLGRHLRKATQARRGPRADAYQVTNPTTTPPPPNSSGR